MLCLCTMMVGASGWEGVRFLLAILQIFFNKIVGEFEAPFGEYGDDAGKRAKVEI